MHELAITKGIIDIVNSEAEKSGFKNVLEITLRVGEYSGIVPECLREFFPIAAAGSVAELAALVIAVVAFATIAVGQEAPKFVLMGLCLSVALLAIAMLQDHYQHKQ